MPKKYFAPKRKNESNLKFILGSIVLVIAVIYGAYLLTNTLRGLWSGGSSAPETLQADLDNARTLLAENKSDEARTLLERIVKRSSDQTVTPQALVLLANLENQAGKSNDALKLFEKAVQEYPTNPERPVIAAQYAKALENAGKKEEALAVYKDLTENAPPGMRAPALLGLGLQKEQAQDLSGARDLFRQAWKDAAVDSDVWNSAVDALGNINIQLAFSSKETPDSKYYTIEKGDSLINIGVKLNTTQGLLMRANNVDETVRLRPGDRLKYTPKDFRILIERSTCRLFLLDDSGLFKRYYVGLGMPDHQTALGSYTIGNKQKDPTWHKPGAGPIPPGDPANELGTRWMPLVPAETGLPTDLGIHGTIAPETIGQYKSHGCPRMKKEDVEELYDLVVRSTPVKIVEKIAPEDLG